MFQLGKLTFGVKKAIIYGSYCEATINKRAGSGSAQEDFSWFIDIDMEKGDFVYELSEEELDTDDPDCDKYGHEFVSPCLYHNNGFQLNISSWKDLEGLVVNWEDEYNENEEEAGFLYVFEHEAVTKGKIEILERHGNVFVIRWSGTANVFWNEEYGENVPFVFEGNVDFTGISAHSDVALTEDALRAAMKKFINMDELVCESQTSHEIIGGTSYVWNFVPAE